MKKVYYILIVALIYATGIYAQDDVIVYKVDTPPTLDGVGDETDIWGNESKVPKQQMELNFGIMYPF